MTSTSGQTAPASGRVRLTFEFVWLAASTIAYQASRMGTGLIAAAFVPPEEYAQWGLVLAILAYSVYLNLGVASGLNRELPRLLGEGKYEAAAKLKEAAFASSLATCVAVVVPVGLIGAAASLDPTVMVLASIAAGAQQLYLFTQTVLRSSFRFNTASLQQGVLAVVFLATSLLLLAQLGVVALLSAQIVAFVVGALFVGPSAMRWPRSVLPEVKHLMRVGFPIMLVGLVFAVFTTVDRWAVLILLGIESTGLYTLAALLSSSALLVSLVLAQHNYPRMAHAMGRGAGSGHVFKMATRQSMAVIVLVGPLAIALVLLAPMLVAELLPEYAQSVPAIQVLVLGVVPLIGASGFANYLVVSGRPSVYLRLLIVGILLELALAALLAPVGLAGIAAAASAAYCFVFVGACALAYARSRSR